ncbi:hypothetical protein T03_7700 [Trichinella britovi]|uniref:Uncharacterized protein n=1 Tax=Trichinella britovi TaxID=45882 RepID=A0A0V1D702_TRIBR|nr:hypothetical protein T03_7700 [Trichinella britovi]
MLVDSGSEDQIGTYSVDSGERRVSIYNRNKQEHEKSMVIQKNRLALGLGDPGPGAHLRPRPWGTICADGVTPAGSVAFRLLPRSLLNDDTPVSNCRFISASVSSVREVQQLLVVGLRLLQLPFYCQCKIKQTENKQILLKLFRSEQHRLSRCDLARGWWPKVADERVAFLCCVCDYKSKGFTLTLVLIGRVRRIVLCEQVERSLSRLPERTN